MVIIGGRVADYHANQRINRQMGQVSRYIRIGAVLTGHAPALTVARTIALGEFAVRGRKVRPPFDPGGR